MPGHAAQKGLTLCKNSIFRSPIHQVFHRIIVGELWQDLYIMTIKTRIYRKISCFWRKDMVCWNSTGLLRNTWEEWASENVKNSEIRLQSETAVFLYIFRCPEGRRFIFYQDGNGCMGNMTARNSLYLAETSRKGDVLWIQELQWSPLLWKTVPKARNWIGCSMNRENI